MALIPVTKTIDRQYYLMFDKEQVFKACQFEGCKKEMIDGCLANMEHGEDDCTCCYIRLINNLKQLPVYVKIQDYPKP